MLCFRVVPRKEWELNMEQVRARDIMSTNLTVVAPKTGIDKVATLMALKLVSAVPVVDEKFHLLGIVSEGDLLTRADTGTLPRPSWWLRLFGDADELARQYTKSHGLTAEDVMVRHIVCVGPETTADQIADIMRRRKIKRVPVTEDGKLVGIVSRADIVQMLALRSADRKSGPRPDAEIQDDVMARLGKEEWAATQFLSVSVRDGVVETAGLVASKDQQQAIGVLIRDISGVRAHRDLTRTMPTVGP